MSVESALWFITGVLAVFSLTLAYCVHPAWVLLSGLVGINLVQAGLTDWCPLTWVLEKAGLKHNREFNPIGRVGDDDAQNRYS